MVPSALHYVLITVTVEEITMFVCGFFLKSISLFKG